MKKKNIVTDGELLNKMSEELEKEYNVFGAYYDYDGLDVKNLKHPFFDKKNNK